MADYGFLEELKTRLRPPPEIRLAAEEALRQLRAVVPHHIEVILGGSVAKNTHTPDKKEADIFLLFPDYYSLQEISILTFKYARQVFREYEVRYANHPYLTVKYKGINLDIVPAYQWTGKPKTPVDRTPLHVRFVREHLKPGQEDEVRLLKAFLKRFGIYGAEIRIEGFSGYLSELLIIWAGSFLELIHRAAEWEPPVHIDLSGQGKVWDYFTVIDPVDPYRNVAAVVSRTSLWRFVAASRLFLRYPSERFFQRRALPQPPEDVFQRRGTFAIGLIFTPKALAEDVLWGKLKSGGYEIKAGLEAAGFYVLGNYFWSDRRRALLFFELANRWAPGVRKHHGPEVWRTDAFWGFLKRHWDYQIHVEHERLVTTRFSEVRSPEEILLNPPKKIRDIMDSEPAVLFNEAVVKAFPEVIADYLYEDVLSPVRKNFPEVH